VSSLGSKAASFDKGRLLPSVPDLCNTLEQRQKIIRLRVIRGSPNKRVRVHTERASAKSYVRFRSIVSTNIVPVTRLILKLLNNDFDRQPLRPPCFGSNPNMCDVMIRVLMRGCLIDADYPFFRHSGSPEFRSIELQFTKQA
jgi:hypothetical protein